ncbi:hypothetical protein P3T76_004798 [Phytophthora citrophthora]|uniref:Uncharacterized protein n=1 Tax=Phytophthora citrophthora TaxID=4793 RepID=A0AAD9LQ70_9STRA|nr:hypothetical protein P3T76_004798 [Phytophthora citrophthora]
MLVVNFSADVEYRKDRVFLQTVREAIELFNVLAEVDTAAVVELLPGYTDIIRELWDVSDTSRRIQLIWDCTLVGQLSSNDPVASKPSVTWGELFGCPDDPWEYSEKFQEAMHRLESIGLENIGDMCSVLESIEYCAKFDGVPVTGDQSVANSGALADFGHFSRGLGGLFSHRAAVPAHLCAVQDGSCLIKSWREQFNQPRTEDAGDEIKIFWPTFSFPRIEHTTTSLVCSPLKTITMTFNGSEIPNLRSTVANAGVFFSTILSGQPVCLPRGMNDLSLPECTATYHKMDLSYGESSELMLAGTCSSIIDLLSLNELKISMASCESEFQWQWLTYALFSAVSRCSVEKLSLIADALTQNDISKIEAVLRSSFPQPGLVMKEFIPATYGYVDLAQGSELRPLLVSQNDVIVVVCRRYKCRALLSTQDHALVVVPGYGICQVSVGDGLNAFVRDSPGDLSALPASTDRIFALELDVKELEDGALVAQLLSLIGKRLTRLSIYYTGGSHQHVDLSDIAASCLHLKYLLLRDFMVSITPNAKVVHEWGIQRLIIEGSSEITDLPACLSDPRCRMAKELVELRVVESETRSQSAWLRNMQVSSEFATSLQQHDGDYLNVTKKKFPLASKAAMLSVIGNLQNSPTEAEGRSGAIHRLNEQLLSSIFQFAAVPEQRIVEAVAYGGPPRPSRLFR